MQQQVPFQLVVLGTDIGTYALARSFHEQWGQKPAVVTLQALGPVQNSKIFDLYVVDKDMADLTAPTALIDALKPLSKVFKQRYPGKKLVLLANIDSNIRDMINRRSELRRHYIMALPSKELVEQTNDKTLFPQLAKQYGLNVPPTFNLDFSHGEEEMISKALQLDYAFPWIIKPASGYGYERLHWQGKMKVYTAQNPEQARRILEDLATHTKAHPQARLFVIQPRIEGNDTFNLSVTAYVDSSHRVTMLGSAQVLLEDHSPTALGNPAAMISEPYPGIYRQVSAFLEGVGWHGFANFDFKVDSRSGEVFCFEINPRIGRNSYYNTGSGMNPLPFMIDDVVFNLRRPLTTIQQHCYYSVLPKRLVLRYVDQVLAGKVKFLHRQGRAVNPLIYSAERGLSLRAIKRALYVHLSRLNHWRKFKRNYPLATFRSGPTASQDTTTLVNPE